MEDFVDILGIMIILHFSSSFNNAFILSSTYEQLTGSHLGDENAMASVCAVKCSITSHENCVGFSVEAGQNDPCHLHLEHTSIASFTHSSGPPLYLKHGESESQMRKE